MEINKKFKLKKNLSSDDYQNDHFHIKSFLNSHLIKNWMIKPVTHWKITQSMFSKILMRDAIPYFKFLQGGSFLICSKDTIGI